MKELGPPPFHSKAEEMMKGNPERVGNYETSW